MKTLNIRYYIVLTLMVLYVAKANSQSYDYLRILRSFPPLPENTLTASKKEVESFKEKLSVINSMLWDLEDAQKEEIRIAESKPYPFGPNDFDKIDAAQKEIDLLLDQIAKVMEPHIEKSVELSSRYREIEDSLFILNQSLFTKLESSNNKDQIYKELHKNRMNSYKKSDLENRENIQFLISECEKLDPVINKLDYFTIDGHRVSYNKTGLQILQQIYKSMEGVFYFNAGNGEEMDPYDSLQIMQQMFKDK